MAKLIFTEDDERIIESLLEEFEPARRLKDVRLREFVPGTVWDGLMRYERTLVRQYVIAGLISNAVLASWGDGSRRPSDYDLRAFAMQISEEFAIAPESDPSYPPRGWDEGVPFDVVSEYEKARSNVAVEPLARILGIEFEPAS